MTIMTMIGFWGGRFSGIIFVKIFDVNKTIGWWLDVRDNWLVIIPEVTFAIFLLGYFIIALMLLKTNFYISLIHFILIAAGAFLFNFRELNFEYILYVYSTSVVVFGYNIYLTYLNRAHKADL